MPEATDEQVSDRPSRETCDEREAGILPEPMRGLPAVGSRGVGNPPVASNVPISTVEPSPAFAAGASRDPANGGLLNFPSRGRAAVSAPPAGRLRVCSEAQL